MCVCVSECIEFDLPLDLASLLSPCRLNMNCSGYDIASSRRHTAWAYVRTTTA